MENNNTISYSKPETTKTIHNWPFGRDRATALFYVEIDPKRGQRGVRVTIDPLTGGKFSPKKLTYCKRVVFADGSDKRTYVIQDTGHFISVMQGTMKYQHETIFPDNPRWLEVIGLFEKADCEVAS